MYVLRVVGSLPGRLNQRLPLTSAAGEDFVDFVEDVTFQPGELRQMVSIGVIDDSAIELTETFSVVLSLPPNAVAILGPQPQIEVIILDNGRNDIMFRF